MNAGAEVAGGVDVIEREFIFLAAEGGFAVGGVVGVIEELIAELGALGIVGVKTVEVDVNVVRRGGGAD